MERDYGLPSSVVGWIYNNSRKNYWRVAEFYEFNDLVQDGLMKAYQCLNKYGKPGVDIDPPHFQSLVKSAFRSHLGDILRKHRRVNITKRFEESEVLYGDNAGADRYVEPVQPEQDFAVFVMTLPDMLRKAVEVYLREPEKLRNLRVRLNGTNETLSERLSKLCGFPADRDFETELRAFIWEDKNIDKTADHSLDLLCSTVSGIVRGKNGLTDEQPVDARQLGYA